MQTNSHATAGALLALCDTFPLLSRILAKTGQFTGCLWVRTLKTRKGVTDTVTKETRATVRAGISYDARAKVQDAREEGVLPAVNAGLPWGQWLAEPYVIQHVKDGALCHYVRLYPVEGRTPRVVYRLNGRRISQDLARELCLASDFSKVDAAIGCMTLGLANLRRVR